jgi:Bax protein
MGILKNYQRIALALIAIGVMALYGAAIAFPGEQRPQASPEWIALPDVAPATILPMAIVPAPTAPATETKLAVAIPAAIDAAATVKRPAAVAVSELRDKFSAASFDLAAVRQDSQPVPRLFVDILPPDFDKLTEAGKLKQTFFQMVLPLTLKVNEEILGDRHQILLLQKKITAGNALSGKEREWLAALAARYDVAPGDMPELLRRVDAISPALALAQSAEESGWGRSWFAVNGNALFGQRTWDKGLGLVPRRRDEGSRHEVRVYPSLLDSVRSYARNLNGHPAYEDFRARRAEMRADAGQLDPYRLIETLTAYSERRESYVETIRKILRLDNLEELEGTRLEGRPIETTQALPRVDGR